MYRKFYEELTAWENNKIQEPLLVVGARQVGKTWIIKEFCENTYDDFVYINLEEQRELVSIFDNSLQPEAILKNISIFLGRQIQRDTTLVIDEIQQSERAITALKYFAEADCNYRVIGAGSLLGVKINRFESSFPVGKVRIKYMYPMDFEEFLLATGEEQLRDAIKYSFEKMIQLPEAIHKKALDIYHDYLIVGGMPAAVNNYVNTSCNIALFDGEILSNLHLAYLADMSKYVRNASETAKITAVYESIPGQLAKPNPKFKYKEIKSTAVKRDYYGPIDWLDSSGMIIKINKIESPRTPLKAYEDIDNFKIYYSDVGILSCECEVNPSDLLQKTHNIYKGAIIENYVLSQLKINYKNLYFYKPSDSMEIDLMIAIDGKTIPIEVKSGRHKSSKSLKNYIETYEPEYAIRISENNFGYVDNIKSIPLYAVFCI